MSIAEDREYLRLVLRNDLTAFIERTLGTVAPAQPYLHNWHIEAMAWHLQQCERGNIKRLLITLPPRHLKSVCASVAFPAWVLGHDPAKRIVCASYSQDLAERHARDCRAVMQAGWYRDIFPQTRFSATKNAALDFETTNHGYRYSTSVGGTLTGRGGSLIIIDDPLKPQEAMSNSKRSSVNDWFDRTLISRLDSKRDDVIILIMQRLHLEDLAGYVLAKEPWVHLNLPAIAEVDEDVQIGDDDFHHRCAGDLLHPEREGAEELEQLRSSLGTFNFSAQYQQSPVPVEGELIKWEWFRFYEHLPPSEPSDRIIQSWDTASTASERSDFSVCTTWLVKGKDYYLKHILREKLLYPDLKAEVINQAHSHGANDVIIEYKGSGMQLIQDLQCEPGVPRPTAFTPDTDKIIRMSAQSSRIVAGQVHLPTRESWLEDFRAELMQFPSGRYDDQVDSLSQFLACVERSPGNRVWTQTWGV